MSPAQLRVARLLLDLTQGDLAASASVSRATVNRFESGAAVGVGQVRLIRHAIEAAGVVVIPDGTVVDGVAVYGGVGLRSSPDAVPADDVGEPSGG